MALRNLRLVLEYDGTGYSGFQRQKGRRTIQQVLEECIEVISGEKVRVTGAGRTDAGVHALGQVVNFTTESRIAQDRWVPALNSVLPPDIRVKEACEVPLEFNARFCARSKVYRYTIDTAPVASVFTRHYAYHVPRPLDYSLMVAASRYLVGKKDFRSFCASGAGVKTFTREVKRIDWRRDGNLLHMEIEADGFLYNMVRIIVGTMIRMSNQGLPPETINDILAARDRRRAGPTAPAKGLVLVSVNY
ncbi:MAG TPA: tRNA pseudouridine(38-40) synthase TruA [Firmicutes bacterium]|nr:tRNA pseudouridine(38-40) synthase TruA [Bacillota bacterium]